MLISFTLSTAGQPLPQFGGEYKTNQGELAFDMSSLGGELDARATTP
jgi:hypothetical protein